MRKSNTNIILIISILLLLASVGFSIYFFKIIANKNKHTSAVVSTIENKIIEKNNIQALQKKMSELGDVHKKIGGYLVDTSQIDTFVEYLEGVGTDNNIELLVKGVEVPKNEKNKVSLSVDMRGDFKDVVKVIALLENAPYNLTITSLYLNKETVQSSEVTNIDGKIKELPVISKSLWQANVSFNVLSI